MLEDPGAPQKWWKLEPLGESTNSWRIQSASNLRALAASVLQIDVKQVANVAFRKSIIEHFVGFARQLSKLIESNNSIATNPAFNAYT